MTDNNNSNAAAGSPAGGAGAGEAVAPPAANPGATDSGSIFDADFLAADRAEHLAKYSDGQESNPAQPDTGDIDAGDSTDADDDGLRSGVPEDGKYDFSKVNGDIDWTDPANSEVGEWWSEQLAANGIPESALPWLKDMAEQFAAQSEQHSWSDPHVQAQEMNKLREAWGDNYESIGRQLKQSLAANVDPDLLTKPLLSTAEGMKVLRKWASQNLGGGNAMTPVMGESTRAESISGVDALKAEQQKLMASEAYRSPWHSDHQATQDRVRELISRRLDMRG